MARVLVLLITSVLTSVLLGSCSSVGEYVPHWAGGLPKDAPPRPGTPEYDAFRQKQDAEAARDKSNDPPKPKPDTPLPR